MEKHYHKIPADLFFLVLLLLPLILSFPSSTNSTQDKIISLSPAAGQVLTSPTNIFAAGFYPVGDNAFTFSVWFLDPFCRLDNCTVVWTANRDRPINGKNSHLSLLRSGNLVLTDADGALVWETKTSTSKSRPSSPRLLLLDSGNLILQSSSGILWQSFDSPTDTLLPNQPLTKDIQLVSSRSPTNQSSGFFKLYFDNDNVLRLLYTDPIVTSVYWPDPELMSWEADRSTYNSTRTASLDSLGYFSSTDGFSFRSADYGLHNFRRITIDSDGNVRLYSRTPEAISWEITWEAMAQSCRIHGSCGPNSLCNHVPGLGRKCSCLPGYLPADESDWSLGCAPEFSLSCKSNKEEAEFVKLTHVEFYGYDFSFKPNYTLEMCEQLCLSRCDCLGFQFKFVKHNHPSNMPYCFAKTMLLNGRHGPDFPGDFYLKVPKGSRSNFTYRDLQSFNLNCPAGVIKQELERTYTRNKPNESIRFVLWFAAAIGVMEFVGISLVWYLVSRSRHGYSSSLDREGGFLYNALGFRRFTYAELKKATGGFKDEIGRGGGGIVYRGILSDERVAAIKKLNEANQAEAEFQAEVSTVGKLNHMNLIEIWGYCTEGKHRLLVYEHMEHGSLAENLATGTLNWETRFGIAMGTAKGLAYLHEECLEWVLHCDVKPQNILLDREYQAKVADFGLSQPMKRDGDDGSGGGGFSRRVRGTRGYMAPEWVYNQPITSKVDVYSYGMVVLEIVTGRSPVAGAAENEVGVVKWVREKVKEAEGGGGRRWVEEIVDSKLGGKFERGKAEVLVKVALRCVGEDKDARPTMRQVVELLS